MPQEQPELLQQRHLDHQVAQTESSEIHGMTPRVWNRQTLAREQTQWQHHAQQRRQDR
jgi:hypothetical protein